MLTQTHSDVSILVQQPIGAPVDVVLPGEGRTAGRCGGYTVHARTGQVMMIVDLGAPISLGSTGLFTTYLLADLSTVQPMNGAPVVSVEG